MRLDLKRGQLIGPYLSAGRVHELHGPLREQALPAGSLYVADRGYWSLERLREWSEQGVRFCQHPKANTVFYDRQGKRINLEMALPRTIGQVKVLHVSLGKKDPLPIRLMMVRVPGEVVEQRRERLKKEAVDKGQPVSEAQWKLAEWTLVVTNASAKQLGVKQALVLLRERWLIELLFKLWKSHGHIDYNGSMISVHPHFSCSSRTRFMLPPKPGFVRVQSFHDQTWSASQISTD